MNKIRFLSSRIWIYSPFKKYVKFYNRPVYKMLWHTEELKH